MCFYNSQSNSALELAKRYGRKTDILEIVEEILEEQKYKVTAFSNPYCPVITPKQDIEIAKWGLIPFWIKTEEEAKKIKNLTLNARAETAFTLPSFRNSIRKKRCLVPSTGYFEFQHQGNEKIPYYLFVKDEEIFSLAGLYEEWTHPVSKETIRTFSILTVPANELCATIHNGGKNPFRMPLIIPKKQEGQWLDNSLPENAIKEFFVSFDMNNMDAYPVSKDFLKKASNDKTIIEPTA
ncbi:MAG: SOS response-associated peptidase [Candidatus Symbiothrix sp.]|jgi:putative SOS response-associated peptidase YedK|nr:SOS response-associated peptidase [Candidatus Symbiothrix sp.]